MTDQLDRREAVLDALFAVLNRLPGVDLTDRNRATPIPEGTRVALVLMDGAEDADEGRPGGRVVVITARPSVWLYVAATQAAVSDRVAHWRRLVVSAVRGERVEAAAEFRFALTFPDTLMEM
ncbi:hypothetical protein [Pararhodospirillum photometricum]|uniref:Uncharacterized protein n=1 Tax=Pararhodospirillum photometricum DSM 122 TaxID=1150469 RepID=H6SKQ5_PARPM|nr:hypothetical protein [Pararhodospirillum photometricum]CCG08570.1 unnamed protein product [Pararhodospirillum photometricum DSM 122]